MTYIRFGTVGSRTYGVSAIKLAMHVQELVSDVNACFRRFLSRLAKPWHQKDPEQVIYMQNTPCVALGNRSIGLGVSVE